MAKLHWWKCEKCSSPCILAYREDGAEPIICPIGLDEKFRFSSWIPCDPAPHIVDEEIARLRLANRQLQLANGQLQSERDEARRAHCEYIIERNRDEGYSLYTKVE